MASSSLSSHSSRDLRMAVLTHSAVVEDPASPPRGTLVLDEEAMAAAAAQGRRRSSLNADTTFMERVHNAAAGDSDEEEEDEQEQQEAMEQAMEQQATTMAPLVCARAASTDSVGSCASLAAAAAAAAVVVEVGGCCYMEAAPPAMLMEVEQEKEEDAACLVLRGESHAVSESPSPSQRAALVDAMGNQASSGLVREAATEEEEPEESGEETDVAAEPTALRVVDHLIAERLISERPELRRYDSADAQLAEERRRKLRQEKQQRGGAGAVHALAGQLQSEMHVSGGEDQEAREVGEEEDGVAVVPASALHHPPRTHTNRRLSEGGYIELPPEVLAAQQARLQGDGAGAEGKPLGMPRPLLAHFDSGDYFKNKAEQKAKAPVAAATAAAAGAGVIKPQEGRKRMEGGHKAAASFLLHRGR